MKRIINHKNYGNPLWRSNDISLLELETEAKITRTVRTICLPKKFKHDETYFDCKLCSVSGWGVTSEDGSSPDVCKVSINQTAPNMHGERKFVRVTEFRVIKTFL